MGKLDGLMGALRDLGTAFEEASAEHPPLLHELLVSHFFSSTGSWWEGFLADSYYPRAVLSEDWRFRLAMYPVSDWGKEWHEVFPDGERCSRYYGDDEGRPAFDKLAGHGYELMRAVASSPGVADTQLAAAIRDPGFRPGGYGQALPYRMVPSEASHPYEERGKFGWLDLVYGTARLYPQTCQVRVHTFGDLEEEQRDHRRNPDVYSPLAFATKFNVEVLGGKEIDIFTLSARVIELWLAEPRPIEVPQPVPINLFKLAEDAEGGGGVRIDPSVERPTWDAVEKELRWGKVVLKRYTKAAENQTTILSTFEDDGWVTVIDDPLTGSDVEPTKRLGDTVRALNKDMLVPGVIKFERFGDGKRVRWRRTF